MPKYDTMLPSAWQTSLEKRIGSHPTYEVIFDPDGAAIPLHGHRGIVDISPISSMRDLNPAYFGRPVYSPVRITLNDPDNYYSPNNVDGPFHNVRGEIQATTSSGQKIIKVKNWSWISFRVGGTYTMSNGTNTEDIIVDTFTANAGSGYHQITAKENLTYSYSADDYVYSETIVGKEVLIRQRMKDVSSNKYLSVFRGKILNDPLIQKGKAVIEISASRQYKIDTILVGPDRTSAKSLKYIDNTGTLVDSVSWPGGWGSDLTWTLSSGSLPSGMTLTSAGTLSGTPTETGTFNITVQVANNTGGTRTVDIAFTVTDPANEEFIEALGLGDFTKHLPLTGPTFDETASSGNCRLTVPSDQSYNLWASDQAPQLRYTPSNLTGTYWSFIAKCTLQTTPADSFHTGVYVRFGSTNSIVWGWDEANNNLTAQRTGESEAFNVSYSGGNTVYLRIRKSSTTFYCDYSSDGVTWTNAGNIVYAGTVQDVGVMARTWASRNLVIDFDYMRYTDGAVTVDTTSVPSGRNGTAYSFTFLASGGDQDNSWTVSSGSAPTGLSLSSAGVLSGTPTVTGDTTFTVQVTDGQSNTDTQEITMTVVAGSSLEIIPDLLVAGEKDRAYSSVTFAIGSSGSLNRTDINVYRNCGLGKWTIEFTDNDGAFNIQGPRYSGTGDKDANFSGGGLQILSTAWGGTILEGDIVTFITGISWEDENPAQIIYDLLNDESGVDNKNIGQSGYFNQVHVGYLKEALDGSSPNNVVANIFTETYIKTGQIVRVYEYSTGEDFYLLTSGNTPATAMPPDITVTGTNYQSRAMPVGSEVWLYPPASPVSSPERIYSLDELYQLCDDNSITMSLTLCKEMTLGQALEVVAAHFHGYTFADHWGKEHVATFMQNDTVNAGTVSGSTYIKKDSVRTEQLAPINRFRVKYGYDNQNDKFLCEYEYPESDNLSEDRHGETIEAEILLPGFYSKTVANKIMESLYNMWQDGLTIVHFDTIQKGITLRQGDRLTLDSDFPELNGVLDIVGIREKKIIKNLNCGFIAILAKQSVE